MEQKILIFKLLVIFCLCLSSFNAFSKEKILGNAVIIDGDTIHIGENKIRLHGIDAPEYRQTCTIDKEIWNCGIESKIALENFILKKEVVCKIIDVDRYRRFVATCFLENQNINQYMVRNGWVIAYRYYSMKFVKDEEFAKKNKLGIWQGSFIEPYLFRKNNK